MINTFKKKPTLEGKRGNRHPHDHQHEHQHTVIDEGNQSLESEEDRESRQYTSFSIYNGADDVGFDGQHNDMIQFERSDSSTKSKKEKFQHSVQKMIKLQALVQKLKSFNSKLVKATLIEMVPLINNPETAVVLKEAGLCDILLDLLKFDPLSHWSIVGLSLQVLLSVVSVPECALAVMTLPTFSQTIETFLRSDTALTQRIAGNIVQRCFAQPLQQEWIVLRDKNMLGLLFKAMELPYKDVQINLLNLLEELTYHCDNTLQLCAYGESVEVDFIQMIVGIVLTEGNTDIRLCAMKIYLNALSAIQFDKRIARAVILHALTVETSLMKHMKSLQRTKMRQTSALLSMSRNSKLFLMGDDSGSSRDTALDIERTHMASARRSSMAKFKSLVDEGEGSGSGPGGARRGVSVRTSLREGGGGPDGAAAGALLQVTEEIAVIAEILWLIRSSVMFQRLVKHTKRTNLVEPKDSINHLLTAL